MAASNTFKLGSIRPSVQQSEEYAAKAYKDYTETTKWEDHHLEYYKAFKKWASGRQITISEETDRKINGMVINIKAFEVTDPKKAAGEKLALYAATTRLWVDATPSLTRELREEAKLNIATISSSYEARELEKKLLSVHMLTNPFIDASIPEAKHYGYLAGVVFDKHQKEDYHSNPEIWWLVHETLYKSWRNRIGKDEDNSPPPPIAPWGEPSKDKAEPEENRNVEEAPQRLVELPKSREAQMELARNKSLDPDTALKLARGYSSAEVGIALAENTTLEKVMEALATGDSSTIKRIIARRTGSEGLLRTLGSDAVLEVKLAVAKNIKTPAETLSAMVDDLLPKDGPPLVNAYTPIDSATIFGAIIRNPNTTNETLEAIEQRATGPLYDYERRTARKELDARKNARNKPAQ